MKTPAFLFLLLALTAYYDLSAQNNYKEVSLPELMKMKKSGDPRMVIIDVRTRGEYGDTSQNKAGNIGHIKGAINMNW